MLRSRISHGFVALSLAAAAASTACDPSEASQPEPPKPKPERRTVVVEVYSSLACAPCRGAEALLADVAAHERVVPLSFHVERHDAEAWTDPYATAAWSARELEYVDAPSRGATIVIDGAVVAPDRKAVRAAIERGHTQPAQARAQVKAFERDGRIVVTATAALASEAAARGHELSIVLTESALLAQIEAGPRAGQIARNDHVVRRVVALATLGAERDARVTAEVTIERDPAWKGPLAVSAVVRDAESGRVLAAKRRRL